MSEMLMFDQEEQIIDRCRMGDRTAFGQLYQKYKDRVMRLAMHLLGNRQDALDQTQESFIRAYQAMGSFEGKASFGTWLMKITFNRCLDFRRSTMRRSCLSLDGRRANPDEDDFDFDPPGREWQNPATCAEQSELTEALSEAIDQLSPEHRMVLTRYAWDDVRYRELAAELGISDGTVMSRLFHARRKVHRMLDSKGVLS